MSQADLGFDFTGDGGVTLSTGGGSLKFENVDC